MENASKALIIAGAILLSILIIGLGMFIFNQASDAMKGANLNQQQAAAHNSQFLKYQGVQTGSSLKTLISTVEQFNISGAADSSEFIKVIPNNSAATEQNNGVSDGAITGAAYNTANVTPAKTGIRVGLRYNVDFGYDPSTGYICAIGFKQVSSTTP